MSCSDKNPALFSATRFSQWHPFARARSHARGTLPALVLLFIAHCSLFTMAVLAEDAPDLLPVPHPDLSQFEQGVRQTLWDTISGFEQQSAETEGEQLGFFYAQMGMAYQAHHLHYVAEPCYLNAVALAPEDFRWEHLLAFLYQDTGQMDKAAIHYERVLQLRPDYLPARLRLAQSLMDAAQLDDAARNFNEVLTVDSENSSALAGLGQIAIERKRYRQAIENLERALELDPQADKLYYPLALAYRGNGETEKAREALAKRGRRPAVLADPILAAMSEFSQSAQLFMERGFAAVASQDLDKAAMNFERAIEINPEDTSSLATLGRVRELQGRETEAMALFDRALSVSPQQPYANFFKGALLERQGDVEAAVRHYNAAIRSDPNYMEPRFLLASALMRAGSFDAAAGHFEKIRSKKVNNAEVRYWAGLAWLGAGQCRRAVATLEEAVHLLPTKGELIQALTRAYATCPSSSDQQRQQCLKYAIELYEVKPDQETATTYAMALAANGQFNDAQDLLAQAMFEVIRAGAEPSEFQRETMTHFRDGIPAEKAWAEDDPIFFPPMLEPQVPVAPRNH